MARDVVLDAGPIVAHLDPHDQWHARCAAAWTAVVHRCVTTEAVVTEACHVVLRGGGPAALPLQFLLAAEIPVLGLDPPSQRYAALLMERYADLPMDLRRVFTTDRRGFATYRGAHGKRFALVPGA